ncbi:MAG: murein L,D-transpeptidase catalytic domain family protein [Myxococcales bacterium]|nr:murein L,D-transpeptidase catalytic domain family protein [Myxococcales bacterium]
MPQGQDGGSGGKKPPAPLRYELPKWTGGSADELSTGLGSALREGAGKLLGSAGLSSSKLSARADVEAAVWALSPAFEKLSHRDALRYAVRAYLNFRQANPGALLNPYLFFVDFGLNNLTRRGCAFDMGALKVADGPFTVSHGWGSASERDGVPAHFSNEEGSDATSLGLFATGAQTFPFQGSAATGSYESIALELHGLSGAFNDKAHERRLVLHGAPYVTESDAGRSEGSPALEMKRAKRLLPMLANGGVAFFFSPHDAVWMSKDPWVHAS